MPKGDQGHAFADVSRHLDKKCLINLRWQRYVPISEEIQLAQEAGRKYMTIASRILARET
jgi:hypothetical protein